MSAEVETMAWTAEKPWHGLGKEVPADLTPQQMLEAAELDWTVEKRPLTYRYNDGEKRKTGTVEDSMGLIRDSDGRCLDVVGKDWNPLQNEEAFEFFNDFVCAGEMEMHTAGSLRDGQLVWGLAKVNETFEAVKGDAVENYLLFTNPHKYGASIDIRMTPIRVVCNNTLSMALREVSSNVVRVSHRTEFDGDMAKQTMGVASEKLKAYKETAKFLAKKKFNEETLVEYFNRVFPSKSKKGKESLGTRRALEAIENAPGSKFAKGSWWNAFNAITYINTHQMGHNQESRLEGVWYGRYAKINQEAMNLALEYAEAA